MSIKVYHVAGATTYSNWIKDREIVKNIEDADLVVFEGGADWSPELYGRTKHPYTGNDLTQDRYEWQIFEKGLKLGKKFLGVCRGGQGGCIFSSGLLVQHMHHPHLHAIKTIDNKTIEVNSSHHQMMYPFELPKEHYKMIAWSENISPIHQDGSQEEMEIPVEPEIVYFTKTKFLSIQSHPEWMKLDSPIVVYCRDLVDKLLSEKL